jgi:hypothetical protein
MATMFLNFRAMNCYKKYFDIRIKTATGENMSFLLILYLFNDISVTQTVQH